MDDVTTQPLRLRVPGAAGVTAAAVLLALSPAAGVLDGSRPVAELLLLACPAVALAAGFLLPALTVDEHGLDVAGVLRRHRVPWGAVVQVRQGWFVELELGGSRRVRCLAAPVVGSMTSFRTLDEDENHLMSRRSARHPAFPGASGSLAVELVQARRPARSGSPGAPHPPVEVVRRGGAALLLAGLGVVWLAALVLVLR